MATKPSAVENFETFARYFESLPGILTDLKAHNDRAARDQTERDYAQLWELVDRLGLCNVVTLLANVAEEQRDEHPDAPDWQTATDVLVEAAEAVDLKYEESERDPRPVAVQDAEDRIQHRCGSSHDYELVRRFA